MRWQRGSFAPVLTVCALLALLAVGPGPWESAAYRVTPERPAQVAADLAPGWQQRRGEEALRRVDFPWRDLGFDVVFLAARSGYKGLTHEGSRRVEVYVRESMPVEEIAHIVAHELGHAYDLARLDDAERQRYKALRGYAGRPDWHTCNACTDFDTPAGDLAETFAYVHLHGETEWKSTVAPPPRGRQFEALARFFGGSALRPRWEAWPDPIPDA